MNKHLQRLWWWFYAELPAYYSVPFIGFLLILAVGTMMNG